MFVVEKIVHKIQQTFYEARLFWKALPTHSIALIEVFHTCINSYE